MNPNLSAASIHTENQCLNFLYKPVTMQLLLHWLSRFLSSRLFSIVKTNIEPTDHFVDKHVQVHEHVHADATLGLERGGP